MFSVSGDGDAQLGTLVSELNRVREEAARLPRYVGGEVMRLTRRSFVDGRSPTGRRWATPLRGGQPLHDTGRLMRGFVLSSDGNSFTVTAGVFWAGVHNEGMEIHAKNSPYLIFPVGRGRGRRWAKVESVTIPERRFIPEPDNEGPVWLAAIESVVDIAVFGSIPR